MGIIRRLPSSVVSQIAAGEVIERPAYAVKELVDNAVDAGADYIRVDIEKSGLRKLSVTDNGHGMDEKDLLMCFEPHATSKMPTDDLHNIRMLGFRGEALASIAAVGNLTVRSRQKDASTGYEVVVTENGLGTISPVGMPEGTVVTVEGLFDQVPARKKFLNNTVSEAHRIIELLLSLMVANPRIRFFVTHNGKAVIDAPGEQTTLERIRHLFGDEISKGLMEIHAERPHVRISGYIGRPQLASGTQKQSYVLVNGRAVKDRKLSLLVKEGYGTLLPPHSYPVFILSIDVPHDTVDVNVHPRKEEVHFMHAEQVFDLVRTAVPETLAGNNLTYYDARWKRSKRNVYGSIVEDARLRAGGTNTYAATILTSELFPDAAHAARIKPETATQIHNTYLVVESDHGMLVIDQHAADERILFERYSAAYKKHLAASPQHVLEKSVILTLSSAAAHILESHADMFAGAGFDIDHFGGNSFAIKTVPQLLKDRAPDELVKEMLEDIAEHNHVKDIDTKSQRMLAYLACKSAVKSGDTLSKERIAELIHDLLDTPNNATCPHGRPTMIETDIRMLHKSFKRL